MITTLRIAKLTARDLVRNKWSLIYACFLFVVTEGLLTMLSDFSKVSVSLLNIVLYIIPLVSVIFGATYFYNAKEFVRLLLAQPISRFSIFLGLTLGLLASLGTAFILGLLTPFLLHGLLFSELIGTVVLMVAIGLALMAAFVGLGMLVTVIIDDKARGMGMSILIWSVLALVYDGVVLFAVKLLSDYPIERGILISMLLNPIDLSRTILIYKMDLSALLGYTGAIFRRFFNDSTGLWISSFSLVAWSVIPIALGLKLVNRKDF